MFGCWQFCLGLRTAAVQCALMAVLLARGATELTKLQLLGENRLTTRQSLRTLERLQRCVLPSAPDRPGWGLNLFYCTRCTHLHGKIWCRRCSKLNMSSRESGMVACDDCDWDKSPHAALLASIHNEVSVADFIRCRACEFWFCEECRPEHRVVDRPQCAYA